MDVELPAQWAEVVEAAEAETQEMWPLSVLCSENSSTEEGHTGSKLTHI